MGGIEPTRGYVLELLRAGKSVVSANKQLLSRHGEELFAEAERQGVQLRFEASVCAAIPVIKVLRESMIVSGVHRIDGIVNGTTNFILSRDDRTRGRSYADALAEAQELGYAEADPTEDVTGRRRCRQDRDPGVDRIPHPRAAGGGRLRRHRRPRPGRRRSTPPTLGYSVKLIASALRVDARVSARVHPCLLAPGPSAGRGRGCVQRDDAAGESIREVILRAPAQAAKRPPPR